jgi:hypothetical protein
MVDRDNRWGLRLAALMALLVLALGAASCGGDDGDDGDDGAAAKAQSQGEVDPASFDDSPEGQIRALHARFINVFYDKDLETVCDLTTRKGKRQWAEGPATSCEDGLKRFFDSVSGLAKNRPRVLRVRIDGDRALATTRVKGSQVYPVQFRKEDGEWKMDAGGAP